MKVYAVKIILAHPERGCRYGEEVAAYTLNKERAEEICKAEMERIAALPHWWIGYYGTNGVPVVEVEELGEVAE